MNRISRLKFAVALFALALLMPAMASAQAFVSAPASTALTYTVAEQLTVTTDTPSLNLTTVQQTINVTTTWNVQTNRTTISTIAYFTSATPLSGTFGSVNASDILGEGQDGESPCTIASTNQSQLGYPGPSVGNNACAAVYTAGASIIDVPGNTTKPFKIRISPTASYAPGSYTGTLFFISAVS
jgi:hypothetical protein